MKYRSQILCIIFILFTITISVQSAEKKICHYCSKEITKLFIKVNEFYFHPSHFICERCQHTIEGSSYYFENDKFYDDSCYQIISTLYCHYCKKEITGGYTEYEGEKYHKKCYKKVSALPCALCGLNITSTYIVYDGKNYHESCYDNSIALKCSLCGKIIEGKYYTDSYNNNYHSYHENSCHSCKYCGGYFDNTTQKQGTIYDDGRAICSICSQSAINTIDDIEPLLVEVNNKLKSLSFDIPLKKIKIHLVGKQMLDKLLDNPSPNSQGFTSFYQSKNLFGVTLSRDIDVYLLYGMPRMWTISTLAHEFCHVWQSLQKFEDKESAFCEGSCNYVSYLVLQQYNDNDASFIIKGMFADNDPDYGEGFRRVDKFVTEKGFATWKNRLKNHKTLPNGY